MARRDDQTPLEVSFAKYILAMFSQHYEPETALHFNHYTVDVSYGLKPLTMSKDPDSYATDGAKQVPTRVNIMITDYDGVDRGYTLKTSSVTSKRFHHDVSCATLDLAMPDVKITEFLADHNVKSSILLTPDFAYYGNGLFIFCEVATSSCEDRLRIYCKEKYDKYAAALRAHSNIRYKILIIGVTFNKMILNSAMDPNWLASHLVHRYHVTKEFQLSQLAINDLSFITEEERQRSEAFERLAAFSTTISFSQMDVTDPKDRDFINQKWRDRINMMKCEPSETIANPQFLREVNAQKMRFSMEDDPETIQINLSEEARNNIIPGQHLRTDQKSISHIPFIHAKMFPQMKPDDECISSVFPTLSAQYHDPKGLRELYNAAISECAKKGHDPSIGGAQLLQSKFFGHLMEDAQEIERAAREMIDVIVQQKEKSTDLVDNPKFQVKINWNSMHPNTIANLQRKGVNAKKDSDRADIKQHHSDQQSHFSHETNCDDIAKFIDHEWVEVGVNPRIDFYFELVQSQLKMIGVPDYTDNIAYLHYFFSTDVFHFWLFYSVLQFELLGLLANRTKTEDDWILKRMELYPVWILMKTSGTTKVCYYSIMFPSAWLKDENNWFPFPKCHKMGPWAFMNFHSANVTQLSAGSKAVAQLIAAYVDLIAAFKLPILRGESKANVPSDVKKEVNFLSLLILENKHNTGMVVQLVRYVIMAMTTSYPFKPKFNGVLEKLPVFVFSRLSIFCMQRIFDFCKKNKSNYYHPTLIDGKTQYPPLENPFTGSLLPDLRSVVSLFGYANIQDKNAKLYENIQAQLTDKVLVEEDKFHLADPIILSGNSRCMRRPNAHEHDVYTMVAGCDLAKATLAKKYGSYETYVSRSMKDYLLKISVDDLMTTKSSSTVDGTDITIAKFQELNPKGYKRTMLAESILGFFGKLGIKPLLDPMVLDKLAAEKKMDVLWIDMFQKNQIGSIREIYVLTAVGRLIAAFIEACSRSLCQMMGEEMLAHPKDKEKSVHRHSKRVKDCENQGYIFLHSNASNDKSKWSQRNSVHNLAVFVEKMFPEPFATICLHFLKMWIGRKILLPPKLIELLKNGSFKPQTIKSFQELLEVAQGLLTKEFYKTGDAFFTIFSGMMQGILHFLSSIKHWVYLNHLILILCESVTQRFLIPLISDLKLNDPTHSNLYDDLKATLVADFMVSSDDSSLMLSLGLKSDNIDYVLSTAHQRRIVKRHMVEFLAWCHSFDYEFCRYYSMEPSPKSAIHQPFIMEFNSVWYDCWRMVMPTMKFSLTSIMCPDSERLFDTYQANRNALLPLAQSGAPNCQVFMVQLAQYFHNCLTKGLFNTTTAINHFPMELSAFDLGTGMWLLDNPHAPGIMPTSFNVYAAAKTSRNAMISFLSLIKTGHFDFSGTSFPIRSVAIRRAQKTKAGEKRQQMLTELLGHVESTSTINSRALEDPSILFPMSNHPDAIIVKLLTMFSSPKIYAEMGTSTGEHRAAAILHYSLYRRCLTLGLDVIELMNDTVEPKWSLSELLRSITHLIENNKDMNVDLNEDDLLRHLQSHFPNYSFYDSVLAYSKKLCKGYWASHQYSVVRKQIIQTNAMEAPLLVHAQKVMYYMWTNANDPDKDTYTQMYPVLNKLYPWLKPTLFETCATMKRSPMDVCMLLQSLNKGHRSVEIHSPASRGGSSHFGLLHYMRRAFWPDTLSNVLPDSNMETNELRQSALVLNNLFCVPLTTDHMRDWAASIIKKTVSRASVHAKFWVSNNEKRMQILRMFLLLSNNSNIITNPPDIKSVVNACTSLNKGHDGYFLVRQHQENDFTYTGFGVWNGVHKGIPVKMFLRDSIITRIWASHVAQEHIQQGEWVKSIVDWARKNNFKFRISDCRLEYGLKFTPDGKYEVAKSIRKGTPVHFHRSKTHHLNVWSSIHFHVDTKEVTLYAENVITDQRALKHLQTNLHDITSSLPPADQDLWEKALLNDLGIPPMGSGLEIPSISFRKKILTFRYKHTSVCDDLEVPKVLPRGWVKPPNAIRQPMQKEIIQVVTKEISRKVLNQREAQILGNLVRAATLTDEDEWQEICSDIPFRLQDIDDTRSRFRDPETISKLFWISFESSLTKFTKITQRQSRASEVEISQVEETGDLLSEEELAERLLSFNQGFETLFEKGSFSEMKDTFSTGAGLNVFSTIALGFPTVHGSQLRDHAGIVTLEAFGRKVESCHRFLCQDLVFHRLKFNCVQLLSSDQSNITETANLIPEIASSVAEGYKLLTTVVGDGSCVYQAYSAILSFDKNLYWSPADLKYLLGILIAKEIHAKTIITVAGVPRTMHDSLSMFVQEMYSYYEKHPVPNDHEVIAVYQREVTQNRHAMGTALEVELLNKFFSTNYRFVSEWMEFSWEHLKKWCIPGQYVIHVNQQHCYPMIRSDSHSLLSYNIVYPTEPQFYVTQYHLDQQGKKSLPWVPFSHRVQMAEHSRFPASTISAIKADFTKMVAQGQMDQSLTVLDSNKGTPRIWDTYVPSKGIEHPLASHSSSTSLRSVNTIKSWTMLMDALPEFIGVAADESPKKYPVDYESGCTDFLPASSLEMAEHHKPIKISTAIEMAKKIERTKQWYQFQLTEDGLMIGSKPFVMPPLTKTRELRSLDNNLLGSAISALPCHTIYHERIRNEMLRAALNSFSPPPITYKQDSKNVVLSKEISPRRKVRLSPDVVSTWRKVQQETKQDSPPKTKEPSIDEAIEERWLQTPIELPTVKIAEGDGKVIDLRLRISTITSEDVELYGAMLRYVASGDAPSSIVNCISQCTTSLQKLMLVNISALQRSAKISDLERDELIDLVMVDPLRNLIKIPMPVDRPISSDRDLTLIPPEGLEQFKLELHSMPISYETPKPQPQFSHVAPTKRKKRKTYRHRMGRHLFRPAIPHNKAIKKIDLLRQQSKYPVSFRPTKKDHSDSDDDDIEDQGHFLEDTDYAPSDPASQLLAVKNKKLRDMDMWSGEPMLSAHFDDVKPSLRSPMGNFASHKRFEKITEEIMTSLPVEDRSSAVIRGEIYDKVKMLDIQSINQILYLKRFALTMKPQEPIEEEPVSDSDKDSSSEDEEEERKKDEEAIRIIRSGL